MADPAPRVELPPLQTRTHAIASLPWRIPSDPADMDALVALAEEARHHLEANPDPSPAGR